MNPLILAIKKATTNNGSGYNTTDTDANFKYVTALLHGQGTNNATNNVFVDSSSNNFAIARNGTVTQGTFTPYGSDFSYLFNGSTDYLTYAPGSGNVFGTADFTVECWLNPSVAVNAQYMIDNRNTTLGASGSWCFYFAGTSGSQLGWFNGTTSLYDPSTTDVPVGQWTHVAYCRASGTGRLFVNGVIVASGADTTNYSASSTIAYIGTRFNQQTSPNTFWSGYLSQIRITKSARYTANFTVATASFSTDSNTTLATAKANRFKDSGVNAYAMTIVGTPKVVRFNPFGDEGTSYAAATYGGSTYFDGSGSNLQGPQTSAGAITLTGDFTLECWYYPLSTANCYIYSQWYGNTPSLCSFIVSITNNFVNLGYGIGASNGNLTGTSASVIPYQWNHIAVTRTSNTIRLFVNGVQDASTWSLSGAFNTGPIGPTIGATTSVTGGYVNGYVCDARIVNGTSLYSTSFFPTGPLTVVTNTAFMLKMQNAGIFDSAMQQPMSVNGSAAISTVKAKFGSSSIYFANTTSYLQTPASQVPAWSSSNWTVEAWISPVSGTATGCIASPRTSSYSYGPWSFELASGCLKLLCSTGSSWQVNTTSTTTVAASTWTHVAMVRNGTSVTGYINGVAVCSGTVTGSLMAQGTAPLTIGLNGTTGSSLVQFNGYMNDFRVTYGIARYTGTFTPSTVPFPDK